jgi:site-specific recombinase XerD
MSGMRDYTDEELTLVRQSFAGRYALRDRCYFEMALQMGLRVSEMLSIRVGQVYQFGKIVDKDLKDLDPSIPLFMSRVRNKDGTRRAISREQCWRIVKGIARENEIIGVATHSTRKTLARKAMAWSNDIRVVQKLLGHRSLSSTEHYLKSLTDREVWTAFQTAIAAA